MQSDRRRYVLSALAWLACPQILPGAGCGSRRLPADPLSAITAELDDVVASPTVAGRTRLRELLKHEQATVRAIAAQAAAAARDWDSMPVLIDLLDDTEPSVAARAASACAVLLGMDHAFDPRGTPVERARKRDAITRTYEAMRKNPPPQYR